RPLGHARIALYVIATHAVRGDHLAFEVADQVERQAAELGGEGLVREHRVDADAVDADPGCRRVVVPYPKLGQLGPSTTCEIEHMSSGTCTSRALASGPGSRGRPAAAAAAFSA